MGILCAVDAFLWCCHRKKWIPGVNVIGKIANPNDKSNYELRLFLALIGVISLNLLNKIDIVIVRDSFFVSSLGNKK